MMKALSLALSLPLVACVVGSPGGGPTGSPGSGSDPGSGSNPGSGSDPGGGSGVSGHITADTTWSGVTDITGNVTVDPGIKLTISPGATVNIASGVGITVLGTLDASGTTGNIITLQPAAGAAHFGAGEGGITVGDGTSPAVLTYSYVNQVGGGMLVEGAATANIMDTVMAGSPGDFFTTSLGATVVMKYSQLGLDMPTGNTDSTHCQTHFNGGALTMVHTNVFASQTPGSSYGSMFYGGTGAKFMYDNWIATVATAVNVAPTTGASGDFSNGYFMGGTVPSMAGITYNNPSATRLGACTGANDMVCAGPHP
jgi:hypothetical protein